jgi:DNA-binding NarL/FixJ family response regulator
MRTAFAVFLVARLFYLLCMVANSCEKVPSGAPPSNLGDLLGLPIQILIADDNALVRAAMRQVLEAAEQGWEIVEAADGKEAVAQAERLKPNLVILDLVMPVMDGLAASREIAKLLPGVPILMHTLHSTPQLELEAGKFGIRRVVPKSDSAGLVAAVQDTVNSTPLVAAAGDELLALAEVTARRRTEDKIRELCTQLFATNRDETPGPIFSELQDALHQHIEHLRRRLAEYPVVVERRLRTGIPPPDIPTQENLANELNSTVSNGAATATADPPEQVRQ